MMKTWRYLITIMTVAIFADCALFAQARKQVSYDWAADQLTPTFFYTVDDYSLQVSSTSLKRTRLTGGGVEYASRHFYPWEIVGSAQYSGGHPLGQKLLSIEGGAGYCRSLKHWTPFARITGGAVRTSSGELMYLYVAPKWGLALNTSIGADYQLTPRWGIRGVQLQNEYLPYGSRGSVNWSIGTGITYHFRP
jgi:hypothetical protein